MNPDELAAQVKQRAQENFKMKLNCAEDELEAEMAYPNDMVKRVSQPFQENVEGLK